MQLAAGKKIYFLSDFHLGAPDEATSREREKRIVTFLDQIRKETQVLFILGDLFDFWFEYNKVVPKGYVRILGKLAELSDAGIQLHFFVGNHDMWMHDYFKKELNCPVYFHHREFSFNGKNFLIGHGDGLGPGDHSYKFLKKVFRNPLAQWMFGIIPSRVGISLADFFSRRSRAQSGGEDEIFTGEENEWLITFSKQQLQQKHYHYFVFGHRHLPIDYRLNGDSRYINLGDWLKYDTYAVFDGEDMRLLSYSGHDNKIIRNW